jgi:hypothetical protein
LQLPPLTATTLSLAIAQYYRTATKPIPICISQTLRIPLCGSADCCDIFGMHVISFLLLRAPPANSAKILPKMVASLQPIHAIYLFLRLDNEIVESPPVEISTTILWIKKVWRQAFPLLGVPF